MLVILPRCSFFSCSYHPAAGQAPGWFFYVGPLGVQGVDYVYKLQGWLKGVNTTSPNPSTGGGGLDPGGDGVSGVRTARDAYGFSLNYNTTDYTAINSSVLPYVAVGNGLPQLGADGGNVSD